MKKENISTIVFLAVVIIGIIRFSDSSVYEALTTPNMDAIHEYAKKSLSWGIFFGAVITAFILLLKKLFTKQK